MMESTSASAGVPAEIFFHRGHAAGCRSFRRNELRSDEALRDESGDLLEGIKLAD